MNKKIVSILIMASILIGSVALITGCSSSNNNIAKNNIEVGMNDVDNSVQIETDVEIEVGKEAPSFTLKTLDGNVASLSDYRGKIVLINFWATWCKYCDMEMPDLQKFDNENDDLVVLAVNVKESKTTVEKYINNGGYTFPVLLDEDSTLSNTYLVSAFPTSYLVDENGILLGTVQGMMTYDQMNNILENIRDNK